MYRVARQYCTTLEYFLEQVLESVGARGSARSAHRGHDPRGEDSTRVVRCGSDPRGPAPEPHPPLLALAGDYCNLPLYVKSDAFFRKPDAHEPCPVVPPREASIRNLARAYHAQARHMTLEPGAKPLGLPPPASAATTLPQRTLPMPGTTSTAAAPAASAVPAPAAAEPPAAAAEARVPTHSKVGGSRDSLLEMSTSGVSRSQKQGAGAYSKSYTLV